MRNRAPGILGRERGGGRKGRGDRGRGGGEGGGEEKGGGRGGGGGGGDLKHECDSDFSPFGLHDADDWHAMPQPRPLSAASCSTNANPQE